MPKSHKSTAGWRGRRDKRQEEAQGRQLVWEGLSYEKQLENLDARPGASTKQRERIQQRIEIAKAKAEQKKKKQSKGKPPRQKSQKKKDKKAKS